MISVSDLSIKYSAGPLFEKVSLQFNPGNRYGLVGANGSGKTTFLRILAGDETGYDGKVHIPRELSVGVLRQDHFRFEEERVVDVVIGGNSELYEAMQEKNRLLNAEHSESLGEDIAKIEEQIVASEGYSAEARACRLLDGLGVTTEMHFEPLRQLSGGYKLRVLLARLLFQDPDILLLDEPTNHLDILSIAWLEDYLIRQFKGLLILISHDRHFINRVCNYISDVDFQTITLYKGSYTKYMEARNLAMEQKLTEIKSLEKKAEELQQFVDRFRAKASKAKQAQSRAKQLEKIDLPQIIRSSRRYPAFSFKQVRPSGRDVLTVKSVSKSFGDNHVLNNISFTLERGERVGLIGPNGMGKTTLLKIITNNLKPDEGTVHWGYETHTAYFAQDHRELLVDNKTKKLTVFDWMVQNCNDPKPGKIRSILAAALFTQDDSEKKIESLSGGERGRLVLASIMEKKPNILILDEPTNHLDLESIEALEGALSEFEGTILFVSHDKDFVSSAARKIFEIRPEGLEIHEGSYEEYLDKLGSDYLERDVDSKSRPGKSAEKGVSNHQAKYQDRKDKKKLLQKLSKANQNFEKEIQVEEAEIEKIVAMFAAPGFYEKTENADVKKLETEKSDRETRLASLLEQWEKAQTELSDLRAELEQLARL
ncbi:MAG: ATP-binding cassette domain-containing protein [Leptospirales bacterium]